MHFPAGLREGLHRSGKIDEKTVRAKIGCIAGACAEFDREIAAKQCRDFNIAAAEERRACKGDRNAGRICLRKTRQRSDR